MKRNKKNIYKVPEKAKLKEKNFFSAKTPFATKQNKTGIDNGNLNKFLTYWNRLTPKQKIYFAIAILAASGITLTALYYLLPSVLASLNNLGQNSIPDKAKTLPATNFPNQPTSTPKEVYAHGTATKGTFFNNNSAKNQNFLNKVAQVKVITDPRLQKAIQRFPEETRRSMQKAIDTQIEITKAVLPTVIHPTLLQGIIAEPNFTIEISHRIIIQSLGTYEQRSNKIYAAVDINSDRQFITRTLKNEFHMAAIRMQNFAKSNKRASLPDDPFILATPYVDEQWAKNPILADKLHHTIETSNNRIKILIALYSKQLSSMTLTAKEQIVYNRFLEILENYQPHIQEYRVPYQFFNEFKQGLKSTPNGEAKYSIAQSLMYRFETKPPLNLNAYIFSVIDDNTSDEIIIRYKYANHDSPQEKARSFFAEYFERNWRFSKTGPYTEFELSRDETNVEISSDIAEMQPEILTAIYGEWCDFFNKYHEVEDYCTYSVPM